MTVDSVCLFVLVPSKPENSAYVSSTESSLTLSWKQSGTVDKYTIKYNETVPKSVDVIGVGNVSATVRDLPTSGAYYCISVTAVSGHLNSDSVSICNYTGMMPTCSLLLEHCSFGFMFVPMYACLSVFQLSFYLSFCLS